jgi:hypothetical protein
LYAFGIRYLAIIAGSYVCAWVLGTKEIIIALVIGIISTLPALLFNPSESFSANVLDILMYGGAGAFGGTIRFGFKQGLHQQTLVRSVVGISLTVIGYILMVIMALGNLVYIAPMLARSRIESPISYAQLMVLFVLGLAGGLIAYTGRRIVRTPGHKVIAQAKGNYVLYLRAFSDDDLQLEEEPETKSIWENSQFRAMFGGFKMILESTKDSSFEGQLTSILKDEIGPVVALMKPGETLPPVSGAARLTIKSDEWQVEIKKVMHDSRLVLMTMGTGAGLFWELDQMLQIAPQKLLIAIPPVNEEVIIERLKALRTVFSTHEMAVSDPPKDPRFLYINQGAVCFSTGAGESIGAYRVALKKIPQLEPKATNQRLQTDAAGPRG